MNTTTLQSSLEQKLWALFAPTVADFNLRLVRVHFMRGTLQVMLEPSEATPENRLSVTLDECATVSRALSALLDVADSIAERYTLEVSSTGIERPLVTLEDLNAYAGNRVLAKTSLPIAGAKRHVGLLVGCADGVITLALPNAEKISLPLSQTHSVELAPTEAEYAELLKKAAAKSA